LRGGSLAVVELIMDKDPPVISVDKTIREVAILMSERQVSHVVVLDGKKPVGIITSTDIVRRVVAAGLDPAKIAAKSVMSSPLYKVHPATSIEDAARTMSRFRLKRLVVVNEKDDLLGLLTVDQVALWLAKAKGFKDPILNALCQYSEPPEETPYM
jgi:CBS domain-containing protein